MCLSLDDVTSKGRKFRLRTGAFSLSPLCQIAVSSLCRKNIAGLFSVLCKAIAPSVQSPCTSGAAAMHKVCRGSAPFLWLPADSLVFAHRCLQWGKVGVSGRHAGSCCRVSGACNLPTRGICLPPAGLSTPISRYFQCLRSP